MSEFISDTVAVQFDAFQLFEATPSMNVLFLPDEPYYSIVAITDQMLQYLNLKKENIIGKSPFDAFPASPKDPDFTGHKNIKASFEYVRLHKKPSEIKVQRYDIALANGDYKEIYWQVINYPIFDREGQLAYIHLTAKDITEQVQLQKKAQAASQNFNLVLNHSLAPLAILKGHHLQFSFVNEAFESLMGHGGLVGNNLIDALPELQGQPIYLYIKRRF